MQVGIEHHLRIVPFAFEFSSRYLLEAFQFNPSASGVLSCGLKATKTGGMRTRSMMDTPTYLECITDSRNDLITGM